MRRVLVLSLLVCFSTSFAWAQRPQAGPISEETFPTPRAPSAELLKHEFEETKKLSAQLAQLAAEVEEELEEGGQNVLPLATLKKLKEIEKLARKIHGRLQR